MSAYQEALDRLNDNQRRAVTTTEGPVLVVAGPGTGKTQLLTTRVAYILANTDAQAHNILCLTFTESGVHAMKDRLLSLIGPDAHAVNISTYHAFGSDLIRRFPEYFAAFAQREPIDDLGIDQLLRGIISGLPFGHPLKYADTYINDIKTFISNAKQAALTADDLKSLARHNEAFLLKAGPIVQEVFSSMRSVNAKSAPLFTQFAEQLALLTTSANPIPRVADLCQLMQAELATALEEYALTNKTRPLTEWKKRWLAKNDNDQFVITSQKANQKLVGGADIYAAYQQALADQNAFDYDDMILQAIQALATQSELRYNLQEQYLYIMLDEFQDTNGAQLRLVELLTNNPAAEGRPNVLAVGDDDQAIYAFQGASHSHMLQFMRMYRDVTTVQLTQNYRSTNDILKTAQNISDQIDERLSSLLPAAGKTALHAANSSLPKPQIVQRRQAVTSVGMYAWVAHTIKQLIRSGVLPQEIAVLAPKHKQLEPLLPYLQQADVPVRYEKRENVLDDPAVNQLVRMSELVLALARQDIPTANALWTEIISFDFWNLPTSLVWQLSWQANDDDQTWTETLLQNEQLKPIALFFIRMSLEAGAQTHETMLDYLTGLTPCDLHEPGFAAYVSPFYDFYFGETAKQTQLGTYWQLLANLTTLRERLREHRRTENGVLNLTDFVQFVQAHREANLKIINTNPYLEAADSVQLLTAFKAKGQEYQAVFCLSMHDDVWGNSARGQGSRMSLPQNLQFIRYAGMNQDERLRLLFVALTRAKTQLYLLSYTDSFAGKATKRLAFLQETTDEAGHITSPLLPQSMQTVLPAEEPHTHPDSPTLTPYWQQRHASTVVKGDLKLLLKERLERFVLGPTHVGTFTNIIDQGPEFFFQTTLLRFPRAPIPAGAYGNAIHETLQWIHLFNKRNHELPDSAAVTTYFTKRMRSQRLTPQQTVQFIERGTAALTQYLILRGHTILPTNEHEYNFRNEGIRLGEARLGGKIDKLIIDRQAKTIQIVDFKTGKSSHRWQHDIKPHRYKQQLYLYKALVEHSQTFRGYQVTDAYLEFVEPDEHGRIHELHLAFDHDEEKRIKLLAQAVWQRVQTLQLPSTANFAADLSGVEAFENALIEADHA